MVKLTGGGYGSRPTSHVQAPKVEPVSHRANPAGAAQLGRSVNFRKEPLEQGRGYEPSKMGPTGIANATFNASQQGPGSGRTIFKSGSQSPTPPAREMPTGRNTLSEYGPEISGPSRRR